MARSVKCLPCKCENLWIPSKRRWFLFCNPNSGVKGGGGGVGDRQILRAFWLDTVKRRVIMGLVARKFGALCALSEDQSLTPSTHTQWFSTLLTLPPFNIVPYSVLTQP